MKKKIVAIIQARMGSTRLPGKVLKPILGKPMLWHIVSRVNKSKLVDKLIIATSNNPNSDKIYNFCKKYKINIFRGSEADVLDRFLHAAKYTHADIIIRLTADCPLIDPKIVDQLISMFKKGDYDYAAVATGAGVARERINKFPDGMDCEIFTYESLKIAFKEAKKQAEREHVTLYIWRSGKFKLGKLISKDDYSFLRFVVDLPTDLRFVRKVYKNLFPKNPNFGLSEIVNLLKKKPELLKINQQNIGQEGYEKLWEENSEMKNSFKKEFKEYKIPSNLKKISSIVVLAAEEVNIAGENGERIQKGFDLLKKINIKKFIFLGTKKHNEILKRYFSKFKFEAELIIPTNRISASTKTQILDLGHFVKKNMLDNLIIVSHSYHIPRIKRYCGKYLLAINIGFCSIGKIKDQTKQVLSENQKIVDYSKKGDLKLIV